MLTRTNAADGRAISKRNQASNRRAATHVDAALGTRIRLARLAKGMTQEKLADALGLTFQQVQKYEKGTNRVTVARLMQIADALGVPFAELVADATRAHKGEPGAPELRLIAECPAARKLMVTVGRLFANGREADIPALVVVAETFARDL